MGILNFTPHTWATNELVTSALLNTELRDPLTALQATWTAYTPVLTASTTNPTLGSGGTLTGAYHQLGKSIFWTVDLLFGTAPSAGSGNYWITLPIPAKDTFKTLASVYYLSAGTGQYVGVARDETATNKVEFMFHGYSSRWGAGGAPAAPSANSRLSLSGLYLTA